MPSYQNSLLIRHPFRWFLKAATVGFVSVGLLGMVLSWGEPRWLYGTLWHGLLGVLFSLILWGGFELAWPFLSRCRPDWSPRKAAVVIQGRSLALYAALWTLCILAVKPIFGLDMTRNPTSLVISYLAGLLMTSLVMGIHVFSDVVAATRDLEQARARASFLALESQLSPHTLFNALNTVAALIPEDPRAAEAAVERLSRFLRSTLKALELERWPLAEELHLVEHLLELERARFGDRLQYVVELAPGEGERPIPPLLVLPLVENSLKHGFRPKVGPCRLEIRAEGSRLTIQDDGVGRPAEAPEGVGLRTVRERLEAVGGRLSWPVCDTGTCVELRLP